MRKRRPDDVSASGKWKVIKLIVVSSNYRSEALNIAHNLPTRKYLGVNKTQDIILQYFYWPKLRRRVAEFGKTCLVCQRVGKLNQNVKPAPLKPVPAFDMKFSEVIIDCAGPVPKTKSEKKVTCLHSCVPYKVSKSNSFEEDLIPCHYEGFDHFYLFLAVSAELMPWCRYISRLSNVHITSIDHPTLKPRFLRNHGAN